MFVITIRSGPGNFVHDRLVTGRRFKCLTMSDPCSKEMPVVDADVSIGEARVYRILDRLFLTRPLPEALILDVGLNSRSTL